MGTEGLIRVAGRISNAFGTLHRIKQIKIHHKSVGFFLAMVTGWGVWQAPISSLYETGILFLATLSSAVVLWILEVFDEYVVALMLLLSWVVFGGIPTKVALAGFSQSSWFFALGAVGMAAGIAKAGLFRRVALMLLHCMPPVYGIYNFTLAATGLLVTPFLPNAKARLSIVSPMSHAITESLGFTPRSNGSAGISLSAYIGFSQMSFVFLTGASSCLIGWNLLSEEARAQFGWATWTIAAFPAGIFMLLFLFLANLVLFPLKGTHQSSSIESTLDRQPKDLGRLSSGEWISLAVLGLAIAGWLGKPFHGIGEAWVALAALLVFLVTRVLDKNGLKNDIDWGFLLFFGVMSSVGAIMVHLKMDQWLLEILDPVISTVSFHPTAFLLTVLLLVYFIRFFVHKAPAVILLMVSLTPWAQSMGIHPGVLLLTVLIGIESWFLPYQTDSYLIAYYITDGKAFSHGQARKLMAAKFVASFFAVALSVPYWSALGFIIPPIHQSQYSVLPHGEVTAETPRAENAIAESLAATSTGRLSGTVTLKMDPLEPTTRQLDVEATDRASTIASIQRLLAQIGYNPGPVDGILGPLMRTAIRSFQQHSGLVADGRPSQVLLTALQERNEQLNTAPQ